MKNTFKYVVGKYIDIQYDKVPDQALGLLKESKTYSNIIRGVYSTFLVSPWEAMDQYNSDLDRPRLKQEDYEFLKWLVMIAEKEKASYIRILK